MKRDAARTEQGSFQYRFPFAMTDVRHFDSLFPDDAVDNPKEPDGQGAITAQRPFKSRTEKWERSKQFKFVYDHGEQRIRDTA